MADYIEFDDGTKYYTNKYIEKLREENIQAEAGSRMWNFIPQEGFQESVLTNEADVLIVGGKRGGGKMQPYDAKVLTPFGFTEMGSLKVGSLVLNPTGQIQHVLQVFEHGEQDVYRFKFIDGAEVESGLDHLWLAKKTCSTLKIKNESINDNDSQFRGVIMTTRQIVDFIKRKKEDCENKTIANKNILVPLCNPVTFTVGQSSNIPIHPYVLGCIIGDGCISSANSVMFTSADKEIVDRIESFGYQLSKQSEKYAYRFSNKSNIVKDLQSLKLMGKLSYDKHIPKRYKTTSVEYRIELVRGLMDTDGYVDDRGHMSYTTVSKQLAEDVQFIIRSLGGKATITTKTPEYTHSGEKRKGALAYTVYINTKINQDLVSLTRKKNRTRPYFNGGVSELSNRIIDVEYVGKKQCRCITVTNPNGLYITNDFVVTHNTAVMLMSPLYNMDVRGFACHGFRKEENDIKRGFWEGARRMYDGVAELKESTFTAEFNEGGARVIFEHMQNEKEIDRRFRGVEIPHMLIDELPQIGFKTFFTLLASNRNSLGIRNKFIASCNPVGKKHWVYQMIKWYIDENTNEIIHERSGVVRYFFKYGDRITDIAWGDTKEEVYQKAKGYIDAIYDKGISETLDKYSLITSFSFIEGEYAQNKIFIKKDPNYLGRLAQQGGAQSVKDIKGIWGDTEEGEELLSADEFDSMFSNSQKYINGFRCATADVALSGDYFTLWAFEDKHVVDCQSFTGVLSDAAVDITRKFLHDNNIREENFAYDSNGLGLFLEGFFKKAKKFNNKERASNPALWNNQKSECAEKFEKSVRKGEYSFNPRVLKKIVGSMTIQEKLESQRSAFKKKPNDNGRFEIISKSQMKQECGHSPDELEALFMREVFEGKQKSRKNIGML